LAKRNAGVAKDRARGGKRLCPLKDRVRIASETGKKRAGPTKGGTRAWATEQKKLRVRSRTAPDRFGTGRTSSSKKTLERKFKKSPFREQKKDHFLEREPGDLD